MTLTVGSLFSGIGGFDLGLERAGMKVIWQSEIDPFACKVLKKHWPEVPNYGDIKQIDWATVPRPDVICGGYPCQPFSTAGKRRGTDDPRHLWPWVRTAISELRPRYAILENVRGHLTMGALQVLGEITELGYDAEWRIVSAAGVGAPHRRDRLIIVAYPANQRQQSGENESQSEFDRLGDDEAQLGGVTANNSRIQGTAELADTKGKQGNGGQPRSDHEEPRKEGLQKQIGTSGTNVADTKGSSRRSKEPHGLRPRVWQTTELREPLSAGATIGDWWKVEPDVGRVADGVPNRVDKLRGLGNAIVPQVAELVGALVVEHSQN